MCIVLLQGDANGTEPIPEESRPSSAFLLDENRPRPIDWGSFEEPDFVGKSCSDSECDAGAMQPSGTRAGSSNSNDDHELHADRHAVPDMRSTDHEAVVDEPAPVIQQFVPEPATASISVSDHLVSIRYCESTDDYQAINEAGPFYGAYQFLQSTWNAAVAGAGYPEFVGVLPIYAPPHVQDAAAVWLYNNSGPGQWPVCQYR